ncbi:MAG: hypothetical protein IJW37_06345 [Lachnospiraceae bacterium]|nr:hypothetical protein [Lachnospiraceae bacterium]
MVVSNVKVYGLESAVRGSKFPMATKTEELNSDVVPTTYKLATCERGSGHDQFMTGIIVQFDLTFTVKAWTEAERYHFLDFISSQSTMHRIAKFDLDNQYSEYTDKRMIAIMNELKDKYNETGDPEDYLRLLYSNPCGFKLTAAMTTNYRQLKTIYAQRKNHRLPEWREFCAWVETLPYAEFITGKKQETEA